jgi:hypothetical protein
MLQAMAYGGREDGLFNNVSIISVENFEAGLTLC